MTENNYDEKAQEAREYLGIAEALLKKEVSEKDRGKLEIFVGLLEGIESKYKTIALLPEDERRRWIAQKEGKELEFLKQIEENLPGKQEDLEFIATNPEAILYSAIELMNERYGV